MSGTTPRVIDGVRRPGPDVRADTLADGQGRGVFAVRTFESGEFIGYFEGRISKTRTRMTLQFGRDLHVEAREDGALRFLNHACHPKAVFRGRDLYAARDIAEGEEIRIDYTCHEFELACPFDCHCGAEDCIGRVRGYRHLSDAQKQVRADRIGNWLR